MTKQEYVMVMYSYVNTFCQKILERYQKENNIFPGSSEKWDRIPVWVFWWQGESNMPDMVQLCIASMHQNLPKDFVDIHIIDKHNFSEYIQLPDIVQRRYDEDVIKIAHYSDILRSALLYHYGGWWLDATIFVAKELPADFICGTSFFSQKYGFEVDAPYPDPARGRWATYLLRSFKGNIFFRFVYDCWLFYLDRHQTLLDYYLTDYLFALAYDNFDWARNMIDGVPQNNLHTGDLMAFYGNQEYDGAWLDTLFADTQFFKMTYKANLNKSTESGIETNYGYLCRKYLGNK